MSVPRGGAVKVCGIMHPDDARTALEAGAHFLGLVFSRSPRQVAPEEVRPWMEELRRSFPSSLWVGVFLPEDAERVGSLTAELGLDLIQFHGGPVPGMVYDLGRPVLGGLRLRGPGETSPSVEPRAWALLVDAFDPQREGGTGRTFPWDWVSGWSERRRIILSGGLRPENVVAAIRAVRPYGVDASSGLEASPGRPGRIRRKDPKRVRDYVRAAREAFREAGASGPRTGRTQESGGHGETH
jgi:phosphoribosylanthranilate isomerase